MRERDFNFNSHSSRKASSIIMQSRGRYWYQFRGTWYLVQYQDAVYYRIRVLSVISLCLVELAVPFRNLRGLP